MDLNDLKVVWDSQNATRIYSIDEDTLHREVKVKERRFDRRILIRDLLESGLGVLMGLFFLFQGIGSGRSLTTHWFFYLTAAGCFFVAGYLWYGRVRARKQEATFDNTIRGSLEKTIWKIGRQISLLSNVLWWYLLPLALGAGAIIYNTSNAIPQWIRWLFLIVVFVGIYWLNKRAVRTQLLPQKHDYESMLKKLLSDNDAGNSGAEHT